jgi:transposase
VRFSGVTVNPSPTHITRRKISGGAMSLDGLIARDTMLGLMKTCMKLGVSFFTYAGDRLARGAPTQPVLPLALLVACKA